EIDEMRSGVGQRNNPGLVFYQRLDAFIHGIEETAYKAGIEVFREPEIEEGIERVAVAAADDLGDRAVGEAGILRLRRRGDDDPLPVALEDRARPRVPEVVAELVAPAVIAEHGFELLAIIGLNRVEGPVAVERIGRREGEIERQRLAGELEVDLLPAFFRGGSGLEHAEPALGELLVVERQAGCHENAAAMAAGDLADGFDRHRARGDLDDAPARPAHRLDQGFELTDVADRRRHRDAAPT